MNSKDLEQQLRRWREARGRKSGQQPAPAAPAAQKRTVRVNGQNVVVVKRSRSKSAGQIPSQTS